MKREYIPHDRPARTAHAENPRAWWQTCSVNEFKERIAAMKLDEVRGLVQEIAGAIAVTSTVVSDVTAAGEHRSRARRALGFMTEKRRIGTALLVNGEAGSKDARRREAEAMVRRAREAIAAGDALTGLAELERAISCMWEIE